ncbi:MAG: efflux RND transporter permease subunit, partial [Deltaproteobacteria bacterium]|nr:efflux RND transporter permease subunit [Deltaproteobacteria bacterium]
MNLAELAIRRPIFITSLVILMLATGLVSLKRLPVDMYPKINSPTLMVRSVYPGAGPEEVEKLVSKPLEEAISTLPGIKTVRSTSKEGISVVVAEFALEVDLRDADQQLRDRVYATRQRMPEDVQDPAIRRFDPSDMPVITLALSADMAPDKIYDLADQKIKPLLEQVSQVGLVEILGGRKREIHVELDQDKLRNYEVSASMVAARVAAAGQNIPAGKSRNEATETVFRTLGEFSSLDDIAQTVVTFMGNDVGVSIRDLGQVADSLEDETSRTFVNGRPALFFMVFRQSDANIIQVVDDLKARVEKIQASLDTMPQKPRISVVLDSAKGIRDNVTDVKEAIFMGILLTILVVYFFLASWRSTFITGLALPNSLIGAFILMSMMGFSINIMSMMALSLAVGLLIDDAIVVRENIFRHMEMGKPPVKAALEGTKEVTLAVLGTSLTIMAVFGPIGFLSGMVGQFFKEFGLTMVFIIIISTFDALTIAPMLSAYFASPPKTGKTKPKTRLAAAVTRGLTGPLNQAVDGFQQWMVRLVAFYERALWYSLSHPFKILGGSALIFVLSLFLIAFIPKGFFQRPDQGEFVVALEMAPGTSLLAMDQLAGRVTGELAKNPEVETTIITVGSRDLESNVAEITLKLVDESRRDVSTQEMKDRVKQQLAPYQSLAFPTVKDMGGGGGGGRRSFMLNITGENLDQVEQVARKIYQKLQDHPALDGVKLDYQTGKPEFQALVDNRRAEQLGVSSVTIGQELRTLVEGTTPAVFRENGLEYNIRVRLKEDQRDLQANYAKTLVPNINNSLVRLKDVAKPVEATSASAINRENRVRYIQINADVNPKGPGLGKAISDVDKFFTETGLPPGMNYQMPGQAENMKEMQASMGTAMGLGVLFIYLVLASLYESFITPFTLMLVLPLAAIGAFWALFITQTTLDIFSMIGFVLLLGIATKNSILLVDYTHQLVEKGMGRAEALVLAGKTRLRPILMTSFALIAGMLPVAVGFSEVSRQRSSMGITVIGGIITSTILTLVVVPAAYIYIDNFRLWSKRLVQKLLGNTPTEPSPKESPSKKGGK